MATTLLEASVVLFVLMLVIGSSDALYYHMLEHGLHVHKESRAEHLAHTVRAILFPPTMYFAFVATEPEAWVRLYLVGALVAADWATVIWDIFLENRSRQGFGGMRHHEYVVHVLATGAHTAAETLALAGLAVAASTPHVVTEISPIAVFVAAAAALMSTVVALGHVLLYVRPNVTARLF